MLNYKIKSMEQLTDKLMKAAFITSLKVLLLALKIIDHYFNNNQSKSITEFHECF